MNAREENPRFLRVTSVTGLFWRIHLIDIYANLISFFLVTLASTYALALAYKNTKFVLKHKVRQIKKSSTPYLALLRILCDRMCVFVDCSEEGGCSDEGDEQETGGR